MSPFHQFNLKHLCIAMTLCACSTKTVETPPQDTMPILPAMSAEVYTLAPSPPKDPVVARIVAGMSYDEALAGAAAHIALRISQNEGFDTADLNWATIQSGWPYPIQEFRQLATTKDGDPTELLAKLEQSPKTRIGVVRARGQNHDFWVLLTSEVPLEATPFANTHALGSEFWNPFGQDQGVMLSARGPKGGFLESKRGFLLDEQGEWLIEAHKGDALLLRAALYVGIEAPTEALVDYRPSIPEETNLQHEAFLVLNEMHQIYYNSHPGLRHEPALDLSAKLGLDAALSETEPTAIDVRLEKLGFHRAPRGEVQCTGQTVRACLDSLYWSVENRGTLLSEHHRLAGVASARFTDDQILLILNLAAD